jgi:hypothetical protein
MADLDKLSLLQRWWSCRYEIRLSFPYHPPCATPVVRYVVEVAVTVAASVRQAQLDGKAAVSNKPPEGG